MALFLCLSPSVARQSQKRSLLEHSTKVADTSDWWLSDPYHWVSDHQVLFPRWPRGDKEGLYLYDTHTQKETFLVSVSHQMHETGFPFCLDSLCVSPDGTRLLWFDDQKQAVSGARLDGSHYFACIPHFYPGSGAWTKMRWTSDSRHWIAFIHDDEGMTQAMIYDDIPSHEPKTFPTSASDQSDPLESMWPGSKQSLILGNRFLTWAGDDIEGTSGMDILDIGIGEGVVGLKTRHIDLPPNATIQEVAFSPRGDRIAWRLAIQPIIPPKSCVNVALSKGPIEGLRVESLWVSRVDGTRMHEIGSRNLQADEGYQPQIENLNWVAGGKRLSFVYDSVLYTVSAE